MTLAEPAPQTGSSASGSYVYRDPLTLTRWLLGLLGLYVLMRVAALISDLMQWNLLKLAGTIPSSQFEALADANDLRQRVIAILFLIVLVATVVVFACWIVRANRNARALGAVGMTFSPGWSVGWYFIPIAALWKPFQAMREIWKASVDPIGWQSLPTDPILGWWWAGFILSCISGQISFRLPTNTLDDLRVSTAVSTVDDVVDIVATILALVLVERLCRIQRTRQLQLR
jgi:hypothetical protein